MCASPKVVSIENCLHIVICHVVAWTGERYPSFLPQAGERAGLEVLRSGGLPLRSISCSTRESGPYSTSGQHSRAYPEGEGMGELTLRTRKQENWLYPLLLAAGGELPRTMQENSPWW